VKASYPFPASEVLHGSRPFPASVKLAAAVSEGSLIKEKKQKLMQSLICFSCAIVAWRYPSGLEGTEFSGGWLTGRLLVMCAVGSLLFVAALILTFFSRRISAGIALTACLLCLPLYLYFTAPGPYRWVFKGEYSVPLQSRFVWDTGSVIGMFLLGIAVFVCTRALLTADPERVSVSP